ncbi:VC0807 family protein [Phenylobacterium sp.]|uniref:VC0807 family protein n=1 Tax=Phenylobacterium sp. TaxID=1871053 RepID=UPI0025E4E27E|nr:VC0807 family protein [Phenylobacterium sp.]
MTLAETPKGWRALTGHVAVRALFKSVLINLAAPALLYRLAAPQFPADSLLPLAISGVPPILWLAYSVIRLRAIDFLGLFAAENVVVSMAALVLAHTERGALIGRSMQNVILAALFLGSLAAARPLVFHMARQLSTGNDPAKRQSFDATATQPEALRAYRVLTLGWTAALLIKAAGSYWLGANFAAKDFLVFSPLWDLLSDSVLVTASILYGRKALAPPVASETPLAATPIAP